MTLTTIISVNAILGVALAYAIVGLLSFGIHSDQTARKAQVRPARKVEPDRLAA